MIEKAREAARGASLVGAGEQWLTGYTDRSMLTTGDRNAVIEEDTE